MGEKIRRDALAHSAPDPDPAPRRATKKRRKWCGGHVGREHVTGLPQPWVSVGRHMGEELFCLVCGKKLAYRWDKPIFFGFWPGNGDWMNS